jgi:hypothetical protein
MELKTASRSELITTVPLIAFWMLESDERIATRSLLYRESSCTSTVFIDSKYSVGYFSITWRGRARARSGGWSEGARRVSAGARARAGSGGREARRGADALRCERAHIVDEPRRRHLGLDIARNRSNNLLGRRAAAAARARLEREQRREELVGLGARARDLGVGVQAEDLRRVVDRQLAHVVAHVLERLVRRRRKVQRRLGREAIVVREDLGRVKVGEDARDAAAVLVVGDAAAVVELADHV